MNSNEKHLHIRLPMADFSRIKAVCAKENISIQDYVARLLETSTWNKSNPDYSQNEHKLTKADILETLQRTFIFRSMNENELNKIVDGASILNFKKEEKIVKQSEKMASIYVIKNGIVKITIYLASGRKFIADFLGESEIIDVNSIIEGFPSFASATAIIDTTIIAIRKIDLNKIIDSNPSVKSSISEFYKKVFDVTFEKLEDLSTLSADSRLIKVLKVLCKKFGRTLYLTHEDIAGMSFTTVETTTRFLSKLKKRNLITISRGKISIMDPEKLGL